jgi:hypothetical protein
MPRPIAGSNFRLGAGESRLTVLRQQRDRFPRCARLRARPGAAQQSSASIDVVPSEHPGVKRLLAANIAPEIPARVRMLRGMPDCRSALAERQFPLGRGDRIEAVFDGIGRVDASVV